MFNLIIAGGGWQQHADTFDGTRVFEYTSDELVERFRPNGILDVNAVRGLPTVFMEEGTGDELAYVGRITDIRRQGGNFALNYAYDPQVPPIPNSRILEISRELGIADWEFSRTHWAIKEANLFEALYRLTLGQAIRPRVFNLPNAPIDPELVSVMMPFANQFDALYAALTGICAERGFRCQRADDIWLNNAVIEDVVHLIATSSIVIADLTGRNPNVFYEIGVAHTLGKEVVLITQSHEDVPFDLRHLRYVHYLNNGEGHQMLAQQLNRRFDALAVR